MHRLDRHINDIEPRIKAIYKYAPMQEEASLQDSLSSYGWILLDSWVAWRTERYLLRDLNIDDEVGEKWFRTPSSYTASQLKMIWRLQENALQYIKEKTNKSFKDLINGTIQKNRNSFAHYSENIIGRNQDFRTIQLIFRTLSKTFLLYETSSFLEEVAVRLKKHGFENFSVQVGDNNYSIGHIRDSIEVVEETNSFCLLCNRDSSSYFLSFDFNGVEAGIAENGQGIISKPVTSESQKQYQFFKNKGYYQNINCFIDAVLSCWGVVLDM